MNESTVINYSWNKQQKDQQRVVETSQEHNTRYGKALMGEYSNDLYNAISMFTTSEENSYKAYISNDPEMITKYTAIILMTTIRNISEDPAKSKVNKTAIAIGELINICNEENGLNNTSNKEVHAKIGSLMLFILEELGLIKKELFIGSTAKRNYLYISPTQKTSVLINEYTSILKPFFLPSTKIPSSWKKETKGHNIKIPLIKNREKSFEGQENLYIPLNVLQKTPYTINQFILSTAIKAENKDMHLPSLPYDVFYNVPVYENTEEWWKINNEYKRNKARAFSQSSKALQTLTFALDYQNETLYFDHNCDFRTRMYPLTTGLSPQGDDLAKALLQFGRGQKMTPTGVMWLKRTIGSFYGEKDFNKSVKWVERNKSNIFNWVTDPLNNLEWTTFDEPWCFLKACMDYVTYLINPDAIIYGCSHLDGSNNALQHFSLLGKDTELAKYCGILENEDGLDYYELCSKNLQEIVKMEDEEFLLYFGHLICERGFIKTSAMVRSYGSTESQVRKEIKKQLSDAKIKHDKEHIKKMTKKIMLAIDKASTIATEIMNWFNDCAKIIGDNMEWYTPDNILVKHDYMKQKLKQTEISVKGVRIKMSLRIDELGKDGSRIINKNKNKTSLPANIIHSFDAAHLRAIIRYLKAAGVVDVSAIHDCISVHYNDTSIAYRAARETAMEIYSVDHLERLKTYWEERFGKQLPEAPRRGNLSVKSLKKSVGFFA